MATKIASRKNKGRRAQYEVRDLLLKYTQKYGLVPDDIVSRPMGSPGQDLILSPAAQQVIPFAIEVKNCEKLNIHNAMEQSKSNIKPNQTPVVIFRKNNTPLYITMEFEKLLQLLYEK